MPNRYTRLVSAVFDSHSTRAWTTPDEVHRTITARRRKRVGYATAPEAYLGHEILCPKPVTRSDSKVILTIPIVSRRLVAENRQPLLQGIRNGRFLRASEATGDVLVMQRFGSP